jgi:hypothetical protein
MPCITNRRYISALTLAAALPMAGGTGVVHAEADSPVDALVNGEVDLNFRYRFENVDQEGVDEEANASTLKSRLTYNSGSWQGASLTMEFDHVTAVGSDKNYNDTRNGVGDHPTVADPEGANLNQAYLQYDGLFETRVRAGRQRILLDNQRFVGGVGWRQNEQTYDALSFKNTALPDTELFYSYIGHVNRIFGPDDGTPPADFNTDIHLLNASYSGLPGHTIAGYSYWMDFEDAVDLANRTTGAYVKGEFDLGITPFYRLEYADQSDHGNKPEDYSAEYLHGLAGVKSDRWGVKVGYEELGEDDDSAEAFRTPLATLHAFQGSADKFLGTGGFNTPGTGVDIADTYVSGNVSFFGATFAAFYHDYESEDGGDDLGDEINLVAKRSFGEHFGGLIKYADYSSGEQGSGTANDDTEKVWLQLTASF